MTPKKALLWFRNDLRLDDHEVLAQLPESVYQLLCVYCIDPRDWESQDPGISRTGPFRTQFLLESLHQLRQDLRARGNDLLVRIGPPEWVIPEISQDWDPDIIYFEKEIAPYENQVEVELINNVRSRWFIKTYYGKSLIHPLDLPFDIDQLPDVFTKFRNLVEKKASLRPPYPCPDTLPPYPQEEWPTAPIPEFQDICSEKLPPVDPRAKFSYQGGEKSAQEHLTQYFSAPQKALHYKETRNGLLGADFSTRFSAWLSMGNLSPRRIMQQLKDFEAQHGANDSTYWIFFELLWRDYFRFAVWKYGSAFFQKNGIKNQAPSMQAHKGRFEQWRTGQTGQPFVDACMRELLHTGFMSNRGRQNVASYLVKDLNVDWRWGAAWFENRLIDYDPCSNYGNWAYVAGVGNDPRPNRWFNVERQAEMYDPEQSFQHHWLS